jgi:hypothetical protein
LIPNLVGVVPREIHVRVEMSFASTLATNTCNARDRGRAE